MFESVFYQGNKQQRRQGLAHVFDIVIEIDAQRIVVAQLFKCDIVANYFYFLFDG